MKVFLVKQGNGSYLPSNNSDYDSLKKFKVGSTLSCDIKQPRNIGFHKKFFALINLVFENQEIYNNIDHLREELTIEAGFYYRYINHLGFEKKKGKEYKFCKNESRRF